jgi:ATP-dependent RNA helicase DeaD
MNAEATETEAQSPVSTDPDSFAAMGLLPEVMQAVTEMGFLDPMPVQRVVYGRMIAGRDVIVQSRTGSGKTAAFGLPLAQGLIDPAKKVVQALALAPTRELAIQVSKECERIGQYRGLSVVPIYGGAPMGKQLEQLRQGVHMVAGTPGRVLDHLRRGTLQLEGLKVLILDEADEMLSMGFLEDITEIIRRCPKERQTVLFSATVPEDVERIGSRYMREPEKVALSTTADGIGAREITHCYYMVGGMARTKDLMRVLEVERPESAIIFCNTREETNYVAEFLKKHGQDAEAISSDLSQTDRERVMARTKAKNLKYLVATDIAARGIDISDLSHVINFTFPESAEVYVHRTGRTGRAGKSGTAVSLISPRELGNFYMLKLTYKIKPEERTLPSDDQWQSVQEGARVDELKAAIGERNVPAEWLKIARRLWATSDGEKLVAALIQDRLSPDRKRIGDPDPAIAALPASPPAPARDESSGSSEPSGADRDYGSDRGRRSARSSRGGRDDRGVRGGRSDRGDRGGRGGSRGDSRGGSREGSRTDRPRREDRPAAAPRISETINTSDGKEFWEAWVDSKTDAPAAPAGDAPAPSAPAAAAPAAAEGDDAMHTLKPGQVRLYLNLGRRDGLRQPEIQQLLTDKGVTVDEFRVRNSHTYLIVQESNEPAVVAAFHGQTHNDRALVCERAKR